MVFSRSFDGPAVQGALSVGTSVIEAKVGGSVLGERKIVIIQPLDGDIYWGYNSDITTSTGFKLYEGKLVYVQAGESLPVYLISGSSTVGVIVAEVS